MTNGNGDGKIDAGVSAAADASDWVWSGPQESNFVFEHLILAHLWSGGLYDGTSYTSNACDIGYPCAKYQAQGVLPADGGGGIGPTGGISPVAGIRVGYEPGYLSVHDGNKIRWSGTAPATGSWFVYFVAGLTPQEAYAFDTKIDDGLPLSGSFYVTAAGYIYRVPGEPNNEVGTNCLAASNTNTYNLTNTGAIRGCYIDVDGGF